MLFGTAGRTAKVCSTEALSPKNDELAATAMIAPQLLSTPSSAGRAAEAAPGKGSLAFQVPDYSNVVQCSDESNIQVYYVIVLCAAAHAPPHEEGWCSLGCTALCCCSCSN